MGDIDMNGEDMEDLKKRNDDKEDGGGLIVEEKEFILKEDSKMIKAKRWFSDNIFDDIEINEELDEKQMKEEFGDLIEQNKEEKDDDGDFEIVPGTKNKKR